jgi:hypothetical protein
MVYIYNIIHENFVFLHRNTENFDFYIGIPVQIL